MRRAKEYTSVYVFGILIERFVKPRDARSKAEALAGQGFAHVQTRRELVEVKGGSVTE